MNQQCKVCGEPAAGFHFGAFTCEGCKSFFGRTYNNISSISECKNNGVCVINKKNRTACKACRLRKCLLVGMSKSGSRYGRRSNWFKIHCLLQEQQHNSITSQHLQQQPQQPTRHQSAQINHLHIQSQQNYQNNNKIPSLKTAIHQSSNLLVNPFISVGHFLNDNLYPEKKSSSDHQTSPDSDSGASSADPEDGSVLSNKDRLQFDSSPIQERQFICTSSKLSTNLETIRSLSEPINPLLTLPDASISSPSISPPVSSSIIPINIQDEPIDLSLKPRKRCRTTSPKPNPIDGVPKLTPLDLTLVRSNPLSG